ncbi:MAG: DoxX family membrane protein [Proteobacteria bacterium]|nr:DoxX family membrane protein [Pseudomonadota bacterium]
MFVKSMAWLVSPFLWLLNVLIPLGDLIARVWVAQIFLQDGWYKIQSWHNSMQLFSNHFIISPSFTAVLVLGAEIILPILLIIGLGGRIIIFLFLVFNIYTMYSYNFIWTPEGTTNFNQQMAWAMLLMLLMLHGSGRFSVDHWLHKRHGHHLKFKGK